MAWLPSGSLKGPTGADGIQGPSGIQGLPGADGAAGTQGDAYIVQADDSLSVWDSVTDA